MKPGTNKSASRSRFISHCSLAPPFCTTGLECTIVPRETHSGTAETPFDGLDHLPEVLAQRFLAFLELHDDDLEFWDEAWFIAGGFHLEGGRERRSAGTEQITVKMTMALPCVCALISSFKLVVRSQVLCSIVCCVLSSPWASTQLGTYQTRTHLACE